VRKNEIERENEPAREKPTYRKRIKEKESTRGIERKKEKEQMRRERTKIQENERVHAQKIESETRKSVYICICVCVYTKDLCDETYYRLSHWCFC